MCVLLTYFQGPPKPTFGPTLDLLECLGFSGASSLVEGAMKPMLVQPCKP